MNRRVILFMIIGTLLGAGVATAPSVDVTAPAPAVADGAIGTLIGRIQAGRPVAVTVDPAQASALVVAGTWNGGQWSGTVTNRSEQPVSVQEVLLFEGAHGLPPATPVYGESFQMLAQIMGTLLHPTDLGSYPDRRHYRIPEPEGYRTASGLLTVSPAPDQVLALAFTSCRKFIGRIGFNEGRLRIFLETEGCAIPAHGTWELERLGCFPGTDRGAVLETVAQDIQRNHPRALPRTPPTGWCSWYYFYEFVTAEDIRRNLAFAKERLPAVRYIQIDDGYQPKMGDWLDTGTAFGGNAQVVLAQIRRAGFEPAIWVAPFIAEKTSQVFIQHPEWFVKGPDGTPLDSSTVGFGGWRCGPWYVLDGTHPGVQKHLENVFRTMREQWGVTYFKLDANYWGAIHGGTHHDRQATRIEAYRQGMAAIQRGAGSAFILGCNAPIWPSLGLVDGMRTSNDIARGWDAFRTTGWENLARAWQNGRLWWSDPDCVLLTDRSQRDLVDPPKTPAPPIADQEFLLHATALRASGGMVLSGDDLAAIRPDRYARLEKLLVPSGMAMRFADVGFSIGRVQTAPDREEVALFNWGETAVQHTIPVAAGSTVTDFWSGEPRSLDGSSLTCTLAPRSAVLLVVRHPGAQ